MKNLGLNEVVVGLGLALGAGCSKGSIDLGSLNDDTGRTWDGGGTDFDSGAEDGGTPDGGLGSTEEYLFDPCPEGDNLHCMTVATQEQCAKALEIADQLDPSDIRVYPLDGSLTRDGEALLLNLNSADKLALQHFACLELYTADGKEGGGNQGVKGLSFTERDEAHLEVTVVLTPEEWESASVLGLSVGVVDQVVYRWTFQSDSDNTASYFPVDDGEPIW